MDDLLSGEMPDRSLLITFDDAYRSVAEHAGPVLKAHQVPAALFLNPGFVIRPELNFDNVASYCFSIFDSRQLCEIFKGILPIMNENMSISSILSFLPELTFDARRTAKEAILRRIGFGEAELYRLAELYLRPADVSALDSYEIEVGNHTLTHTHLRSLSSKELDLEICEAANLIEGLSGRQVRAFSFPYGHENDATDLALSTIRSCGHSAIFLVHARTNVRRPAADIWYRVSLSDDQAARLPWKLKLLPKLRSIKQRLTW